MSRLTARADIEVWAVSRAFDDDRIGSQHNPLGVPVRIFADTSERRTFPTRDNAEVRQHLRSLSTSCQPFDVIHVEGHYMAHLVPDELMARTVVAEHNIESSLVAQRHQLGTGDQARLETELSDVREQEITAWRRASRIVVLSEEDRSRIVAFDPALPVVIAQNGCNRLSESAQAPRAFDGDWNKRMVFVANYAYAPNVDALAWLLDDIYPRVRETAPAELMLTGSNLTAALCKRRLPKGVTPVGWVDSIEDVHAIAGIGICPLRIGGGVKTKMLEALHFGHALVSTTIGIEGLPQAARHAVIVRDTADGFAAQVAALVNDPGMRSQYSDRAVAARWSLPSWDEAAEVLFEHWVSVAVADRVVAHVK